MHIFIYMCIPYTYISMYTDMHISRNTYVYIHKVYMYIYTYMYMSCMHACMHARLHGDLVGPPGIYIYIYICTYMYIYMYKTSL